MKLIKRMVGTVEVMVPDWNDQATMAEAITEIDRIEVEGSYSTSSMGQHYQTFLKNNVDKL